LNDLVPAIIAGVILLGMWMLLATPVGYLAHRRMGAVERERGAPALPANELPLLLRAVAAIAWPVAAAVGLVAWATRPWARLARDVTLIFLGQITASVLSAIVVTVMHAIEPPRGAVAELFPLLVAASANLAVGALVAAAFLWIWAGRRARRLAGAPPSGPPMGVGRFGIYVASVLLWPAGIILGVVLTAPQDAPVGANAFRCSLVQIACLAIAVCLALPLLARYLLVAPGV
jgi:hypothetical protein